MANKNWSAADIALLNRDHRSGVNIVETAEKLSRTVGDVALKAYGLGLFYGKMPGRSVRRRGDRPLGRGANAMLLAVFDAIAETIPVQRPIQTAVERYIEHNNLPAYQEMGIPKSVAAPEPVSVQSMPADEKSVVSPSEPALGTDPGQVNNMPLDSAEVSVEEPVGSPATPDLDTAAQDMPVHSDAVREDSPLEPEKPRQATVAYLVAGEDDEIDAFLESVRVGIEPSRRPIQKPSVTQKPTPVEVAPAEDVRSPAVEDVVSADHSGVSDVPVPNVSMTPSESREKTDSNVTSSSGPSLIQKKQVAPKPNKEAHRQDSGPSLVSHVSKKPLSVDQEKVNRPTAAPEPPRAAPVAEPVRTTPAEMKEVSKPNTGTVAPVGRNDQDQKVISDQSTGPGVVDESVDTEDMIPSILPNVDPDTGEIITHENRVRRPVQTLGVVRRATESDDSGRQATQAERRARMAQFRKVARKIGPPSGRILSEEEGFRKIMKVLNAVG